MIRKISPLKIFIASLRLLGVKLPFVLKIGWPLILFSALVGMGIDTGILPPPEPVRPEDAPLSAGEVVVGKGWERVVVSVAIVPLTAFAAIFWHRNILLREHATPALPFRFDAVFWRFMGYTVLLGLLLVGAFVILLLLLVMVPVFNTGIGKDVFDYGWPLLLTLLLLTLFITARAGLAFPATAIGNRGFGLRASWRATRGNSWRILVLQILSLLITAPVVFVWELASDAVAAAAGEIPYTVKYLANGAYELFFVLLGVGFLSLTYACLVEEKDLTAV